MLNSTNFIPWKMLENMAKKYFCSVLSTWFCTKHSFQDTLKETLFLYDSDGCNVSTSVFDHSPVLQARWIPFWQKVRIKFALLSYPTEQENLVLLVRKRLYSEIFPTCMPAGLFTSHVSDSVSQWIVPQLSIRINYNGTWSILIQWLIGLW